MDCKLKGILLNAGCISGGLALGYWLFNSNEPKSKQVTAVDNNLTKGETANPYEEVKSVYEYLCFNYGGADVNCVFTNLRPEHGYDFPKVTAEVCLRHFQPSSTPRRALDIGCAVGRAAFELAAEFEEVIGIDFSHHFVKVCNELKAIGKKNYEVLVEGELTSNHIAVVPGHLLRTLVGTDRERAWALAKEALAYRVMCWAAKSPIATAQAPQDRTRCHFQQGDACNLSSDLGEFDCVLAGNLICRLPHPSKFLRRLKTLVKRGGICVITSPYTFLKDYTHRGNWLGGFADESGAEVRGLSTMKQILLPDFDLVEQIDLPFMIRETYRKHQWTVADVTVWRRKN